MSVNYRLNPFTNTFSPVDMTETLTVPSTEPYIIALDELPQKANPSTVHIEGYTEIETGEPAAGQFKCDYNTGADNNPDWNTGLILFNAANAGATVTVTYKGLGTVIRGNKHFSLGLPISPPVGMTSTPPPITPDPPSGLSGTAPTVANGNGTINGTTTEMEYSTSQSGPWTGCGEGTTALPVGTYYVRYRASGEAGASMPVGVAIPAYVPPVILVQSITVQGTRIDNTHAQCTATVLPENATNKSVTWSSNDHRLTVDQNGYCVGTPPLEFNYTVTITATAQDGSGVSGSTQFVVECEGAI